MLWPTPRTWAVCDRDRGVLRQAASMLSHINLDLGCPAGCSLYSSAHRTYSFLNRSPRLCRACSPNRVATKSGIVNATYPAYSCVILANPSESRVPTFVSHLIKILHKIIVIRCYLQAPRCARLGLRSGISFPIVTSVLSISLSRRSYHPPLKHSFLSQIAINWDLDWNFCLSHMLPLWCDCGASWKFPEAAPSLS